MSGVGCQVSGFGFRVSGFRCQGSGVRFRVLGFGGLVSGGIIKNLLLITDLGVAF